MEQQPDLSNSITNNSCILERSRIAGALFGLAVGDAIGVPFEFRSKEDMQNNPATDLTGYGSHHQAPGTWSDDSSLCFCLAESLINGYNLVDIAKKFIEWKEEGLWTARGSVFDIGTTTSKSISELKTILEQDKVEDLKTLRYAAREQDNGNGSLMRILPLLYEIKGIASLDQFQIVWEVSALTHKHIRSAMACFIYIKLAEMLCNGLDKEQAYTEMRNQIMHFWGEIEFPKAERCHFDHVILHDIRSKAEDELKSSGYVIDSLESSIWYFLEKENYRDTVLGIINLGGDTDTGAAIAGGLAGLYYGEKSIPRDWLLHLARYEDINNLINSLLAS